MTVLLLREVERCHHDGLLRRVSIACSRDLLFGIVGEFK
jgi:hypothetical protein